MGHLRSRAADTDIEAQLAQPIRDQVLDQQHSLSCFQNSFDLLCTAVPLWLLADIDHRLFDQMGYERRVWNPCGFAARHDVDVVQSDLGLSLLRQSGDDKLAFRRKRK